MKTLEYFSAGLPVVSTDLPGSRWLRDSLAGSDAAHAGQLMALTSDPAEFVAAVRRLAGAPGAGTEVRGKPPLADRARAFAAEHSWTRRADALAAAIGLRTASPQPDPAGVS
jgi:teichuronic acid biosynthesis glycosyltransferase TuaH